MLILPVKNGDGIKIGDDILLEVFIAKRQVRVLFSGEVSEMYSFFKGDFRDIELKKNITVSFKNGAPGQIRVGIQAPRQCRILRSTLHKKNETRRVNTINKIHEMNELAPAF